MAKKKGGDDFLKKMVIWTFILMGVYLIWCWTAKLVWQADPPEGASIAALSTAVCELLGCSIIQAAKQFAKTAPAAELQKQIKQLEKDKAGLKKQLEGIQKAVGIPGQQKLDT